MAVEDQRAAVGFSITLSGQLIAAGMATLAVECAYVSYALGGRLVPFHFFVISAAAALLILLSIFKGGRGITKARNAGFAANWDLSQGKREFNTQAKCLLIAVVLLGVAFFLSGPIKEQHVEQKLDSLCYQAEMLRKEFESHRNLDSRARGIEEQLSQIGLQLQMLRPAPSVAPVKQQRKRPK